MDFAQSDPRSEVRRGRRTVTGAAPPHLYGSGLDGLSRLVFTPYKFLSIGIEPLLPLLRGSLVNRDSAAFTPLITIRER